MSEIIRRDPHAEWIARNRLHPLHATLQKSPERWMSAAGVVRKNPHAVGFIGPEGIKRIDRSGAQSASAGKRSAAPAAVQLPLHRVEQPAFHICVVPDMVGGRLSSHDKDLLGLARSLAGNNGAVLAIIFAEHKEQAFDTAGVDRLMHFTDDSLAGYSPELRVLALSAVEAQLKPRHWLLPDSRNGGGELGRRLAAKLSERPATRVWQVADGQCIGRAGAGREDSQRALPRLILAAAECASPVSETRHECLAMATPENLAHGLPRIEDCGAVAVDPALIPMAEAEFILSGGNGVSDWTQFHQAAEILGATEGASRVAVDDGFMPRNRQVGATGTWVTARVYLAVGISGAVQHLQGIGACDKVVAVNKDANCDMVKRADLSVIGDSAAILGALIARINAHRHGGIRDAA
ncbi:electron transfer flavoprotein subunit alpha/FixB family protein [Pseudomonas marincola]|uniref:electron transfer flavoprotein subunit alpha n=1 Tax=Pseudomonas marincola TaxID=437900 RepID=UPI0008E4BAB9|nr:electron transfer flavoprotein subunit alpha/FixB family protein [Pseudomonas marincola]SFT61511.1 electron transfer flavoprotein alpha subunit [Pseudomonas marincola]